MSRFESPCHVFGNFLILNFPAGNAKVALNTIIIKNKRIMYKTFLKDNRVIPNFCTYVQFAFYLQSGIKMMI